MTNTNNAMHSQSLVEYGKSLREIKSGLDAPLGSEVIVKVHHCGVCHSDIHLQDGFFNLGNERYFSAGVLHKLPFTLGHEIEGEVIAIGPDAKNISIGERKIVYAWIGCDNCNFCNSGNSHLCNAPQQLGINVNGGYATHVRVPHPKYLMNYSGIEPENAGSFMCAGITAYSALKKLRSLTSEGPILIIGFGGLGMMACQFAKLLFTSPPYVAEIESEKRELAKTLGAQVVIDPAVTKNKREIFNQTGGFIGVVDFVGSEKSANFAVSLLRKGGKLVVAGLYGGEFTYPLPYFPFKSIAIEGSYVGSIHEAREMLELAAKNSFQFIPVNCRPLHEASQALDDLREGKIIGRTVLCP